MDTSTPIAIATYHGDPDGVFLEGCFFKEINPGSGEFLLFAPDGSSIQTTVSSGTNFSFNYNGLNWSITEFFITENAPANTHGKWSAVHVHATAVLAAKSTGTELEGPETGTFQSQDGTGDDYKLTAQASASA